MSKFFTVTQVNGTQADIIRINANCFLFDAIQQHCGVVFDDNHRIKEIIKVMMPEDKLAAYKMWFDGFDFEGAKYYGWFSTVNGLKQEDFTQETKMEVFFIREDFKEFTNWIENIISLGTFKELEGKDICINKDVLSRISLITTTYEQKIKMPNYIILPEAAYPYIKDYVTINRETGKLEDYAFNDTLTPFDGGCVAGTQVFNSINAQYNRKDIEFAIFRNYGTGIKGMMIRMDIIAYLKELHAKTGDTDNLIKVNGQFKIRDMWGEYQVIDNNTILLNETQVKLAKYFKDMTDIEIRKKSINNVLNNWLFISKVNKPNHKISEHKPLNYQLLNALALTPRDLGRLSKVDYTDYKKIISPYVAVEEGDKVSFKTNVDNIMLFYRYITSEDSEIEASICSKINELLQIEPSIVSTGLVKRNLRKVLEKKLRDLACGKITAKAEHKYIGVDPVAYINYYATGCMGENSLKEHEFYSGNVGNGEIRTVSRNPLASFQEVHNVRYVKNEITEKWYPQNREIIIFNNVGDTLNLLSSADEDGDCVLEVDDEIIRSSVVVPEKYFVSTLDGKKKTMVYNDKNRFVASIKASGNLIGKYAIIASSINNASQSFDELLVNDDFEVIKWSELTDEVIREHIKGKFIENYEEIAKCLSVTLCAIDTPKTLTSPAEELKDICEYLEEKYKAKPYFLKFKKTAEEEPKYYMLDVCKSTLNIFSKSVEYNLINKLMVGSRYKNGNTKKYEDYTKPLIKPLIQESFVEDDSYIALYKEIAQINNNYKSERSKVYSLKHKGLSDADGKKIRNEKLAQIDMEYRKLSLRLMMNNPIESIRHALCNIETVEAFLTTIFWEVYAGFEKSIKFVRDDNGELSFKRVIYRKINGTEDNSWRIKQAAINEEKQMGKGRYVELRCSNLAVNPEELLEGEVVAFSKLNVFDDCVKKIEASGYVIGETVTVMRVEKVTAKSFSLLVVA